MPEGTDLGFVALREPEGRIHIVELGNETRKIKGLGVLNPKSLLGGMEIGQSVQIGSKELVVLPLRLPELVLGMKRRAQTISAKDAGLFITKLGIGGADTVLEAGLGSAGLALHLARVLGSAGRLISVETREEHAEVGMANLHRARIAWGEDFPEHHLLIGDVCEQIGDAAAEYGGFDAIILDLPEHSPAIEAAAPHLNIGGRLACYCPVSSQLEAAWESCESAGLVVEWAGELMAREWGRATRGGMRPVNGPFGHTAFLLVAQKIQ
jgi:tRNA (adenine57-N1/adenine58-N1)-methyltransferase